MTYIAVIRIMRVIYVTWKNKFQFNDLTKITSISLLKLYNNELNGAVT